MAAPCVALTFDDGPDPVTTPRVLDVLREKQVRATFFVVGKSAEQHPELVRRALAEGPLVENHTSSSLRRAHHDRSMPSQPAQNT